MSELFYKYREFDKNEYALDILRNKELWLAESKTLNDPFDCQIEYAELFHQAISKLQISEERIQFYKSAAYKVVRNLRVLSLSKSELNPLLWAHYSKSHTGFCLGFDESHFNGFLNLKLRPQAVKYTSVLPSLNLQKHLFSSNLDDKSELRELVSTLNDFTYELALTKPREWKRENEFRIITREPYQGKVIKYKKLALREVIFGLNINEHDQQQIIDILDNNEWKHVKFFKVHKQVGSFKLKKEPL